MIFDSYPWHFINIRPLFRENWCNPVVLAVLHQPVCECSPLLWIWFALVKPMDPLDVRTNGPKNSLDLNSARSSKRKNIKRAWKCLEQWERPQTVLGFSLAEPEREPCVTRSSTFTYHTIFCAGPSLIHVLPLYSTTVCCTRINRGWYHYHLITLLLAIYLLYIVLLLLCSCWGTKHKIYSLVYNKM